MSIQTCNPAYEATPWPDYDCMFKTYINSIVDQQQPVFNSYIMNMNTGVGQSFTPAVSGPLTQIDVNVYNFSGSPTFSVEVFPGNGKSGTPLYSASGYGISSTGWISLSIPIPTEPTLTAGSQYTFWLTPYPYNSVQLGLGYPNPYAPGESWDECILPVVKDVCGTVIPTPTPVIGGSYNGCSGTRTYTYVLRTVLACHLTGSIPIPFSRRLLTCQDLADQRWNVLQMRLCRFPLSLRITVAVS